MPDQSTWESMWTFLRPFFTREWKDLWLGGLASLPDALGTISERVTDSMNRADDSFWDSTVAFMEEHGVLTDENRAFFEQFKEQNTFLSFITGLFTWINTLSKYIGIVQDFSEQPLRYHLAEQSKLNLADPATLIRSAFIAPELTRQVRETLYKQGYSEEQISFMFLSNYSLYDVDTVRVLALRGIFNEDKTFERLREMGFTDTRITEMIKTWEIIPGPQDLLHMVAKEAFEPDMIQKIGLGDEFPEEQVKWLEMQGLSRFWTEKYWYAHWDQPSLQMGFEMFHRGVIDAEGLDMLFRATEIPPFWRDKLTQIAYSPYTRVDVRRMFDQDVIGIDEVYETYLDLGYNQEKALNLTKWTLAQKNPDDKDLSTQQILSAFESRILSREDAKYLLIQLGYIEARAEFILINREYEIEERLQKKKIGVIKEKYTLRLIDKFDAQKDLNLLNLPYGQVQVLMDEWEIELYKDRKLPSKTDLIKFLKKGIIEEATFYNEMDKLGYNHTYSEWYFKDAIGK